MWQRNGILLFLGALAIFLLAATIDPFLHVWDERFHALVAKNMIEEPLVPMLYADPIVDMAYDRWDRAHIWLHKQPLFLWQIALSLKFLGISEFAVRLPSAVMASLLALIAFRMGLLYQNLRTGIISAVLVLSNPFLFELVSGNQGIEHNDVAFLFYVSLSLWAFIEYYKSGKRRWIWLIGVFAGMAILCKWLVGLLVYFGWLLLRAQERQFSLKANRDLLLALMATTLVALPWQMYTWLKFPAEYAAERQYNLLHLFTPVEGHDGDYFYHLNHFGALFGAYFLPIFLLATVFIIKKKQDRKLNIALLGMVGFVYLFFSIAKTKMPAFPLVVMTLVYLLISSFIENLVSRIFVSWSSKKLATTVFGAFLIGIIFLHLNLPKLITKHNRTLAENGYYRGMEANALIFKSLNLPQNFVIFNVPGRHYIECMFYTGLPAYAFIPTEDMCTGLKQKGRQIAVFTESKKNLPDYLKNDLGIIVIEKRLFLVE